MLYHRDLLQNIREQAESQIGATSECNFHKSFGH